MRKPGGYAIITDPDAPTWERDTCMCGHCGKTIYVKPGTVNTVYLIPHRDGIHWSEEPGAGCAICRRPVCLPCHDQGFCKTIEQRLEDWERRPHFIV